MDSTLPIQFILIILFSLFFWSFCFIIFYHLIRFGVGTQPKKLAAIFLIGSVVLYCITIILFISIDMNSLRNNFRQIQTNTLLIQ